MGALQKRGPICLIFNVKHIRCNKNVSANFQSDKMLPRINLNFWGSHHIVQRRKKFHFIFCQPQTSSSKVPEPNFLYCSLLIIQPVITKFKCIANLSNSASKIFFLCSKGFMVLPAPMGGHGATIKTFICLLFLILVLFVYCDS